MRILLFSDLHLHTYRKFGLNSDEGISCRLWEQSKVLDQIVGLCKDYDIRLVINGGDLYHSVGLIPTECLNIAYRFFSSLKSLNIEYLNVWGNHDLVKRVDPMWFHSSTGIFSKERVQVCDVGGLKIRLVSFNDEVLVDKLVGFDILVLHQQPDIVNEYGYRFDESINWKVLAKNNKLVFFGHYHTREVFSDNCFVIGIPMHLTFGDKGDRGIWIVDNEKGIENPTEHYEANGFSIDFIKLAYPEFLTVDTIDQVKDDKNYYRVLNLKDSTDKSNVVGVKIPQVFEERIKSDNFYDILLEWLDLNGKDKTYLEVIKDIISTKTQLEKKFFKGKLDEVCVQDFMSIGYAKYKVRPGFTLIAGQNDTFDSNGSGKTSLVEAIYWCLCGETTKGLLVEDVVRRGEKNCKVDLKLVEKDRSIFVERTKREGLQVIESKGGVSTDLTSGLRQQDRQKVLEQVLGFDKTVYLTSCYFSQENLVMITGLTDAEKTSMITDLLGFEEYDDLYGKVSDKVKSFENVIIDLDMDKIDIDRELAVKKSKLEGLDEQIVQIQNDEIVKISKDIEAQKVRIYNLKIELTTVEQKITSESKDFEIPLGALYDAEKKLQESMDKSRTEIDNLKDFSFEVGKEISDYKIHLKAIDEKIDGFQKEISSLQSLSFGIRCDKCGAIVTKENADDFIKEKFTKIDALKQDVDYFNIRLGNANGKIKLNEEALLEETKKFTLFSNKLGIARQEIRDVSEEKTIYGQGLKDKEVAKSKVLVEMEECSKRITEYEGRINVLNSKLRTLDANKASLSVDADKLQKELDELEWQKDKARKGIEVLEFWKVAFSAKGIRSVLLDRFCNQFNRIANEYLSTVSNGSMSIILSPTKVLKSGEERNKIGISVCIGDIEVKYESLSGGEKKRVDFALCISLNYWCSQKYGIEGGLLGFIVFDELFAFIDKSGEEEIGTLLYNEGKNKAVFVISHTNELGSYSDYTWIVKKEKGVSTLEVS